MIIFMSLYEIVYLFILPLIYKKFILEEKETLFVFKDLVTLFLYIPVLAYNLPIRE